MIDDWFFHEFLGMVFFEFEREEGVGKGRGWVEIWRIQGRRWTREAVRKRGYASW